MMPADMDFIKELFLALIIEDYEDTFTFIALENMTEIMSSHN